MRWIVKAPGSCGELIQGTLDDVPFLITCPINIYTTVYTGRTGKAFTGFDNKARLAHLKTLEYLKHKAAAYSMRLECLLPYGKGMASSSADIAAVCQATALSLGKMLSDDEIARIAISIEPTDGIFYDGIVVFNHIEGVCLKRLGEPPKMRFLILDGGGEIDTIHFNSRADLKSCNQAKEPQIKIAYEMALQAIAEQDCRLLGRACSLSAAANQNILYKRALPKIEQLAEKCGACGINTAHSGTVIGMMFEYDDIDKIAYAIERIKKETADIQIIGEAELISGGLKIEEAAQDEK
jgi:L-threonine kinase